MARKNNALADQVAADMLGIMESDEHKDIFGQTVSLEKTASFDIGQNDDQNDAKGKPPWLEKGDDDEDEKKEKDDDKGEKEEKGEKEDDEKDDEKDEKEDEDDAKSCGPPWMKSKATLSVSIQGLAKISEALDEAGLESGAAATLEALETLVAEAAKIAEADALGVDPKDLDSDIVAELVGEKSPKA